MKIRLRSVTREDVPVFFDQQNDPGAHELVGITSHTPDDKTAFYQKWERIITDLKLIKRTILCDGEIAGNIISFYAPWSKKQEVGYWLGRDFWGKGIASKALAGFLEIEDHRPLFATASSHNKASIQVLKKCGFRRIDTHNVELQDGREIEESHFRLD